MSSSNSIREFGDRLQALRYVDGADEGFLVEQAGPIRIQATFVERIQRTEAVIDPFGREEKFELVEYRKSEFSISEGPTGFEIKDAGRGSSRLISKLLEAVNFDFTISPIAVDPLVWAAKFQEHADRRGLIDKVQIGSIRIGQGAVAQLLVKGTVDVAAAATKFVGEFAYEIERVQLRLAAKQGSIVFLATGAVSITSYIEKDWLGPIRSSLATF
ncbi:hypothetical protein [Phyllobacterium sp. YR531]|uniref:hypothetical protein n=1 Tax=Phyllobacterium sp. YR531 TaxID=1144343 RepID=UPI00026F9877|nr:hypothetical protein [Phyllobacterium sp. YR531]EJN05349.1 hypothetical protein PMI41_01134 [Phyllobacterium sp. YR531]